MYNSILWLVLTIVFALVEAVTPQLISIWFAGGAIVAFVTSLFRIPMYAQLIIFVSVSVVLLILTRPFVKKMLKVEPEAMNSDAKIGRIGIVTEDIDNIKSIGTVKLDGLEWSAKSANDTLILKDTQVKIVAIEGVKLVVEPK